MPGGRRRATQAPRLGARRRSVGGPPAAASACPAWHGAPSRRSPCRADFVESEREPGWVWFDVPASINDDTHAEQSDHVFRGTLPAAVLGQWQFRTPMSIVGGRYCASEVVERILTRCTSAGSNRALKAPFISMVRPSVSNTQAIWIVHSVNRIWIGSVNPAVE